MPSLEHDPHSRHFLMQGNVVPNSAEQLGALWQGKPALQMNLGGWAAEILPRKSMFWVGNHWQGCSVARANVGRGYLLIKPGEELKRVRPGARGVTLGFFTILGGKNKETPLVRDKK